MSEERHIEILSKLDEILNILKTKNEASNKYHEDIQSKLNIIITNTTKPKSHQKG